MTEYKVVNLAILMDEIGEETVDQILSSFSCPLNPDVESFLRNDAKDFAKQGWAQTHLVLASYERQWVLVGYFALANKYILVPAQWVNDASHTLQRRIKKFATLDDGLGVYMLSAPLIAQLGKNYTNEYNRLIDGKDLLGEACRKISSIQADLGGRFAYVECEDKECLTSFYESNGFFNFGIRQLDSDETQMLSGDYLVQFLKYIHKTS